MLDTILGQVSSGNVDIANLAAKLGIDKGMTKRPLLLPNQWMVEC